MDKNLDIEKLVEQARFLSQLMNSGMNNAGETEVGEADRPSGPSKADTDYTGAFSSGDSGVPVPEAAEKQDVIQKAIDAIKIFQALNQSGQTSDNTPAYDNTTVLNGQTDDSTTTDDDTTTEENSTITEDSTTAEDEFDETGKLNENLGMDFSALYDDTFSTPQIKAVKSAVRFIEPRYHKAIGLWIKFMEMQNMLEIYSKRAEDGYSRPEYADWRRGLLLSVRPHASHEKQYFIDLLIKIIELKEVISVMEEFGNGS